MTHPLNSWLMEWIPLVLLVLAYLALLVGFIYMILYPEIDVALQAHYQCWGNATFFGGR